VNYPSPINPVDFRSQDLIKMMFTTLGKNIDCFWKDSRFSIFQPNGHQHLIKMVDTTLGWNIGGFLKVCQFSIFHHIWQVGTCKNFSVFGMSRNVTAMHQKRSKSTIPERCQNMSTGNSITIKFVKFPVFIKFHLTCNNFKLLYYYRACRLSIKKVIQYLLGPHEDSECYSRKDSDRIVDLDLSRNMRPIGHKRSLPTWYPVEHGLTTLVWVVSNRLDIYLHISQFQTCCS